MPENLADVETGSIEIVFADDLQNQEFSLREAAVYSADEVREIEETEIPKYGRWLPVTVGDEQEAWLVGISALLAKVQEYENPVAPTFRVTSIEKTGTQDSDPYQVELEQVSGPDPDQTGLD